MGKPGMECREDVETRASLEETALMVSVGSSAVPSGLGNLCSLTRHYHAGFHMPCLRH